MFRVVASARARSGTYTTLANFFQIQDTVTSQVASTEAPLVRNLGGIAPTEPRTFQVPVLPYPVGHAEILADNYLTLWGRPLQFASFEMVANDDARLLTLRGLRLWDRVSLFDGNDTHFGFVARKVWRYGKITDVRLTMMEDFTEGGDISASRSVCRLNGRSRTSPRSICSLPGHQPSTIKGRGQTKHRAVPQPTNTGPTANNALAFVHTETTGGNRTDHEDNGVLTLDDDVLSIIRNRDVVFRYAAYGAFAAGDGLVVQGRAVITTEVEDMIVAAETVGRSLEDQSGQPGLDAVAPYGRLGDLPSGIATPRGLGITVDGDVLITDPNGRDLWRINVNDPDDETGDYGRVGAFPSGPTNFDAATIDANGDLLAFDRSNNALYRLNIIDPSVTGGIYGSLGFVSGITHGNGMDLDSNGDLWIVDRIFGGTGDLHRVDVSNPSNITAPYGNQGQVAIGSTNASGFIIDSNDDGWLVTTTNRLWKIDLSDPDSVAGDYGNISALPVAVLRATIRRRAVRCAKCRTSARGLTSPRCPRPRIPPATSSAGDTDTDVEGDDYTVAADGGWRDVTVSIPTTYQEIRYGPILIAAATRRGRILRYEAYPARDTIVAGRRFESCRCFSERS